MSNTNKIDKSIFANGKIYLTKKLLDTLDVEVGDTVGVYLDGKTIIVEKYDGTCLHCKEEKVLTPNIRGLCLMCKQHPVDRVEISKRYYTLVKVPKSKFLNIPENVRDSRGYTVEKDESGKIVNEKYDVSLTLFPYKHRVIIKENRKSKESTEE